MIVQVDQVIECGQEAKVLIVRFFAVVLVKHVIEPPSPTINEDDVLTGSMLVPGI
jgi:hypothetical protein